jgi:hypothetical protein
VPPIRCTINRLRYWLSLTAFAFSLFAGEIRPHSFIREKGIYTFDQAGSSIEVITAKDKKLSLAIDFQTRGDHYAQTAKYVFDEEGILRGPGWFVFVESADRLWIFDGVKSLSIAERSGNTHRIKDFDAEAATQCPVPVKTALPKDIREKLFDQHLF